LSTLSQTIAIPKRAREHSTLLRRFRLSQIRFFASFLTLLGHRPTGRHLIVRFRCSGLRLIADWSLGFRRTFPSFEAAQACASKYIQAGHEHPAEIGYHLSISDTLRESDYPVLFHLAPLAENLRRVFDLGGNVGNLFYSYQSQLKFPPDLTWTVFDLPAQRALGEKVAVERGETRIRFVQNLACGKESDLFIASGSLHYFEQRLDDILRGLGSLPKHVLVNRTPCSAGEDLVTVQDTGILLVPCKLHSRSKLVAGMKQLGYRLVAEWPVFERKFCVPMYPDWCSGHYSGFYFKKQ
jgi:putative methyltransferase (TIGR04325 family)